MQLPLPAGSSSQFDRIVAVDPSSPSAGSLPRNLAIARYLDDHTALLSPRCNILVYFWQPSTELKQVLEETPEAELPEASCEISGSDIPSWAKCAQNRIESMLYRELSPYVMEFQKLTRAKHLSSRLQRTQEQMCPLFHVDNIPLRMIVTLIGQGTEWLDEADARRAGLGKGRNDKILREDAMVQQLRPFQIAFMKGQLFHGHYGKGLVHRSPEATGTENFRYIFKVDVISHGH